MSEHKDVQVNSLADPLVHKVFVKAREQMEKNVHQKKDLIKSAQDKGSITAQYASLLALIDTSTTDPSEANLFKVKTALELQPFLKAEGFSQQRIAYIGSGYDWKYAVALGARNIDMVDHLYANESSKVELMKDLQEFGVEPIVNNNSISFEIELGKGIENVTLNLVGADIMQYNPQDELGGVIEIYGPTKTETSNLVTSNIASKIRNGGIIANFDFNPENSPLQKGVDPITHGEFMVYKVKDREGLYIATKENSAKPKSPSLEVLRKIISEQKLPEDKLREN